jgi:methylenetetrahydrofolate reductase (NADPH)
VTERQASASPVGRIDSSTARDAEIARIAAFMGAASYELTRPTAADLDQMRAALPQGTSVYLTAVPGRPIEELIAAARLASERGLRPTPHIAARHFSSLRQIESALVRFVREASVDQIMLIGGDSAPRPDAVADALTVLQSGIVQGAGIRTVGLPGFPDGHPVLTEEELELALVTKIAAAQTAGLEAHIVTQFCFEATPIERWLRWLRNRGLQTPVRVGFAGPTSLMSWLKFARKCGVRASAEALAARSGLARHAFKSVAPDPLVRSIATATAGASFGQIEAHFFAFGGAGATVRWAAPLAKGNLRLNPEGGFDLTSPGP